MIKDVVRAGLEASGLDRILRPIRDQLDRGARSIETPWGFALAGHDEMASGRFEPTETELFRSLLDEVDIVVNVGANVGYYCCHALKAGKPVIAVEPIARNYYYLLRNIRENGWSNQAEVFPVALGAETDVLEMWGTGTGASLIKGWASIPESYRTLVPVLTLDRLLGDQLLNKRALFLVDVEGAEFDLLKGAKHALAATPRPIWMMEIVQTNQGLEKSEPNENYTNTFEMFFAAGYSARTADREGRPVTLADVEDVQAQSRIGYNFIFS